MRQLRWTPRALSDLKKLHAYLSKEAGERIANDQCSLLLAGIQRVRQFPDSAVSAEPLKCCRLNVPHNPYAIFYRERHESIEIIFIRHAAQRPLKRLPKN